MERNSSLQARRRFRILSNYFLIPWEMRVLYCYCIRPLVFRWIDMSINSQSWIYCSWLIKLMSPRSVPAAYLQYLDSDKAIPRGRYIGLECTRQSNKYGIWKMQYAHGANGIWRNNSFRTEYNMYCFSQCKTVYIYTRLKNTLI